MVQGRGSQVRPWESGDVGMTSLADRRVRGDMIATYKILTGKDKIDPAPYHCDLFYKRVAYMTP